MDLEGKKCEICLDASHSFADFYLLETENRPLLPDDYIWIKESDMQQYGIPRLIEILLEKL